MKHRTLPCLLTSFAVVFGSLDRADSAEPRPKEDLIESPAIGEGLCVSNVFQSGMVLQRDKPIRVWGWAKPGERIAVTFGGNEASATANDDRTWAVSLPASSASREPRTMTVRGEGDALVLDDLLVGDVWLLGGQSNMEFELAKVENGPLEIVSANYPLIRILTVPYGEGPELKRGFPQLHQWSDWSGRHFRKGYWEVCSPETAKELSAIGYVFARRIHAASQIPIGVIDASRGGTTVEAWTPSASLRAMESAPTQALLAKFDAAVAAWDPQLDLERRIEQHRRRIERLSAEGKSISEDERTPPDDLGPGPIGDPNFPGNCYAGMIAPLAGLSIKGAIFHQGYNNAFDGSVGVDMYRDVFPEMIASWRRTFDDPKMPFGIISLCTEGYPQTRDDYCEKMFDAGIELRAVQYRTFLDLYESGDANVGYASTYDLRRRWYHPQLKIPAGERIARWALATQYGFGGQIEWKPPMLISVERIEGGLRLEFDAEVGDPEEGAIEGFAVADEDRRFHPADATYAEKGVDDGGRTLYDRKRLVLSSPMVASPAHFRYAWGRNPLANLQAVGNKDLPFATQRSDDWRMEEVPSGALGESVSLPLSGSDRNKILAALREQDVQRRMNEAESTLEELKSLSQPR